MAYSRISGQVNLYFNQIHIPTDFAVFAQEALFAFTSVAPWKILTRSPIAARPGKTLIYIWKQK